MTTKKPDMKKALDKVAGALRRQSLTNKGTPRESTKKEVSYARLAGSINWVVEGELTLDVPVTEAVLRSDALVIDCKTQWEYTVTLKRTGSHLEGRFDGRCGGERWPVQATGRLYSNREGYVVVGDWLEDGYDYKWWAELREVTESENPLDEPGRRP